MVREAPFGESLPLAQGTASAGATLDLLSAHRAGLEAHRELFVARAGALHPGVLLTNRVHPRRSALAIRAARPAAYDALYQAMMAQG